MLPSAVLSTCELKPREESSLLIGEVIELPNFEGILFRLDVSLFLELVDLFEETTGRRVKVLSLFDCLLELRDCYTIEMLLLLRETSLGLSQRGLCRRELVQE